MPTNPIRLDDAHDYLDKIITSLHQLGRNEKGPLVAVLEHLSQYIGSTRREIASLHAEGDGKDPFASASDELDEIVAETAKATNAIMEAAESIDVLAAKADPKTAAKLTDITTRIFEACSFQDITGQRIGKVVRALKGIESRIGVLSQACGASPEPSSPSSTPPAIAAGDASLLNGPQLSGDAKTQEEIDRLFASL